MIGRMGWEEKPLIIPDGFPSYSKADMLQLSRMTRMSAPPKASASGELVSRQALLQCLTHQGRNANCRVNVWGPDIAAGNRERKFEKGKSPVTLVVVA